jgi:hypothetical protein
VVYPVVLIILALPFRIVGLLQKLYLRLSYALHCDISLWNRSGNAHQRCRKYVISLVQYCSPSPLEHKHRRPSVSVVHDLQNLDVLPSERESECGEICEMEQRYQKDGETIGWGARKVVSGIIHLPTKEVR